MTRIYADSTCKHGRNWPTCSKCIAECYCGCCGDGPIKALWCQKCSPHVLKTGEYHRRTYFAQHGTECPHQV